MNKRSLRILEFNKILSMVTEYATSPMAKRRVDRMNPSVTSNRSENYRKRQTMH